MNSHPGNFIRLGLFLLVFDVQNEIQYDEDDEELAGFNGNRDKNKAISSATSVTATATTATTTESLGSNLKVIER